MNERIAAEADEGCLVVIVFETESRSPHPLDARLSDPPKDRCSCLQRGQTGDILKPSGNFTTLFSCLPLYLLVFHRNHLRFQSKGRREATASEQTVRMCNN